MKKLNSILLSLAACLGVFSAAAQDIPEIPASVPVPTHPAADVFSFVGHYGTADGFKRVDYKNGTEQIVDGVMCFTNFYYVKYNFTTVDLTQYESLHFDLWYDSTSTKPFKVSFYNTVTKKQSAVKNVAANTYTPGEWTGIDLNMSDFVNANLDLTEVNQLIFGDDAKTHTVYVTNVYAYGKKSTSPVLGDIVAEIGGKQYIGGADLEAFIGQSLTASVSAKNAESLTVEFDPEVAYTNTDGVINFTVTDNCTATVIATLGETVKTATYRFTFVPEPEKEYPVYIGTKGYDTVALAVAAAQESGEACTITLKQDARFENVMIKSAVTLEGATGNEVITIPTTYRLALKVNNGSLTLRNLIFDGENKTHTATAIVSNDYGLAFEAENVTFRNFTTTFANGLLNLVLNGNKVGTASLKNVRFENCVAENAAGVLSAVNPNLTVTLGEGCDNLSILMPANFKPIVADGSISPLTLYFATAPAADAVLIKNFTDASKISTNLNAKFFALEAADENLCIITKPVNFAEETETPTPGHGYMIVAEIAGKYYGMVANEDKTIAAGLVAVGKDGKISLLNDDYLDFIIKGNEEDGYTFNRDGENLIYRDGALMLDATDDADEKTWMFSEAGLSHKASGKFLTVNVDTPADPEITPAAVTPETDKHFVLGDEDSAIHLYTTGSGITTDVRLTDAVEAADAPAEYYNLQGQRVINPEKGLYIKRCGNKVTKVML